MMCSCELVASPDLWSFTVPFRPRPDWEPGYICKWTVPVPLNPFATPLAVPIVRLLRLLDDVSCERPFLAKTSRDASMSMLYLCQS
jgi:hypothetical protein